MSTPHIPCRARSHAWMTSLAPWDYPQLVVVVFVEHAGTHGGIDSAPRAKLMYQERCGTDMQNARLDLSNPDTIEAIKEGKTPTPGQAVKPPATPVTNGLGH